MKKDGAGGQKELGFRLRQRVTSITAITENMSAGFLVIGPLLGHASWHAYRGAVRWREAEDDDVEPAAAAPAQTT